MATVKTDANGAFKASNIRAGLYIACAEMVAPGLLDPCHWASSAPQFTVTAGQETSGIKVTMARGAVLTIHVADPQGLLKPVTGPTDADCQFHVVTARGFHHNVNIQSSAVGSREHAIAVPLGTPLTLQVISPHLMLNDSTGKAVSAGTLISVAGGAVPSAITYVVAGAK